MKILVLGGSIFIGRHIVETALARGHEVSIFNRGSQEDIFGNQIEKLVGDRRKDLSALQSKHWDIVIDTSGYVPSAVSSTAQLFAGKIESYIYISSLSVYGQVTTAVNETTPVNVIDDAHLDKAESLNSGDESPTAMTYGEYYGPLKARCEQVVNSVFIDNSVILRPGLVVGSHDYTNRLSYWVDRMMRGGVFLAPNNAQTPIRFILARDLAEWTIQCVESNRTGIYNLPGPAGLTFGELFQTIQKHLKNDATPFWVKESQLLKAEVKPWTDLPLWLPEALQGILKIGDQKAVESGIQYSSFARIMDDVINWVHNDTKNYKIKVGLSAERESSLLKQFQGQ